MAAIPYLTKSRPLTNYQSFKSVTTFAHLRQEAAVTDVAEDPQPSPQSPPPPPLPEFKTQNTRYNPISNSASALIPAVPGFFESTQPARVPALSETVDARSLMNQFADWMTTQNWSDIKKLFEFWIRCFDKSGKPNRPDVGLYNHYLRANLMTGASAGELLDLIAGMDEFGVLPNAATYNLVLKAMQREGDTAAAEKLINRMLHTGKEYKESLPDEESYDLVIGMLLSKYQIDAALKYIDLTLKSGYMFSTNSFTRCVRSCIANARLDALVSIIERCKKMDQNKSLLPSWSDCNYIADVAIQSDNSELTFHILEFFAKWIAIGQMARPPVLHSIDEGLVVCSLGTAGRTYCSKLLDGSWAVLKRSLREKKAPHPNSYLAKIYAHSNLGNLQKAFGALFEFETAHRSSDQEGAEDMFSPFTSLNPLVIACSKQGFVSLDSVYYQLEKLSQASPPYKSVSALNCVILGCANIWDADRAYQTFAAINGTFGLSPNIHSYNSLICAFGKLGKIDEAIQVYKHFVELGVKPNTTTYSLLVDAHLPKRNPKAAVSVIDDMIIEGFEPSKEILKKVRRRCIREMDNESDGKVQSFAKQFKIRMGNETGRSLLFNLRYDTDNA